jgi:hypothetical protein
MLEDKIDKCIQMVFSRRLPVASSPYSTLIDHRFRVFFILHHSLPLLLIFLSCLNSFQRLCVRCIFHRVVIEWSPLCVTKIVTRHTRCYVCLLVFLSQHTNTPITQVLSLSLSLSRSPSHIRSLTLGHTHRKKIRERSETCCLFASFYTIGLKPHSLVAEGLIHVRPIRVDHTYFFKWILTLIHSVAECLMHKQLKASYTSGLRPHTIH